LTSAGRTLSSEFTLPSSEINRTLFKLEREHLDLLSLYSKMSDELLHLKTLEKLDKQREKQLNQMKNKMIFNSKEKNEIQNIVKNSEIVLKDFLKRMEKGFLGPEEKKFIAKQIREIFLDSGRSEGDEDIEKNSKVLELWGILPKLEKILKKKKK
jgi:hypothetical protein